MPIYNTLYGLPATSVAYLNQALPDISNIFRPTTPGPTIPTPVPVAPEPGLTPEQLALLYPQNIQTGNDGIKSLNVQDFEEALAERQDRLNNPGGFAEFVYGMLPGLKPQTLADVMKGGYENKAMGIPGIGSLLSSVLPTSFENMTPGEQAFTYSQMGYTDPNTGMANKDAYGYNVVSAFGNYADLVDKRVDIAQSRLDAGKSLRPIDIYYINQQKKKQNMIADTALTKLATEKAIDTGIQSAQDDSDPGIIPSNIKDAGGTAPGGGYATDYYGGGGGRDTGGVESRGGGASYGTQQESGWESSPF